MAKKQGQEEEMIPGGGSHRQAADPEESVDEAFLVWLQGTSSSPPLILMGGYSHPDICWQSNTASCKQSSTLLECAKDNFGSRYWPDQPRRSVAGPGAH